MTATIDLDAVAAAVSAKGIPCYVEQTGGGCATIFVGGTHIDDHGDERYAAVAGPGWFEGPGWTNARAAVGDFSFGFDDDGASEPTWITEPRTAEQIAALLAGLLDGPF